MLDVKVRIKRERTAKNKRESALLKDVGAVLTFLQQLGFSQQKSA